MGTKVARVHKNMQNALGACGLTFVPRILASGSPDLKNFRDTKNFENSGFQDFLISRKTPNFKLVFLYERLVVGNSSFRESEIVQKSGFEHFSC